MTDTKNAYATLSPQLQEVVRTLDDELKDLENRSDMTEEERNTIRQSIEVAKDGLLRKHRVTTGPANDAPVTPTPSRLPEAVQSLNEELNELDSRTDLTKAQREEAREAITSAKDDLVRRQRITAGDEANER